MTQSNPNDEESTEAPEISPPTPSLQRPLGSRGEDLQFDRAEYGETGAPAAGTPEADVPEAEAADSGAAAALGCSRCRQTIAEAYHEVDGQVMCDRCRAAEVEWRTGGSSLGRFVRATVFGCLAGAVGAAIYYAVLALTGYEVGLISIAVGFLVGIAVNFGAHRRGGWFYQLLAVGITYCAIVSTYVPGMLEMLREMPMTAEQAEEAPAGAGSAADEPPVTGLFLDDDEAAPGAAAGSETDRDPADGEPRTAESAATPPAFEEPESFEDLSLEEQQAFNDAFRMVMAVALAFVAPVIMPFIGGFGGILGLLIVGFGLWEAWRLNRRQPFEVAGPFRLGPPVPEP